MKRLRWLSAYVLFVSIVGVDLCYGDETVSYERPDPGENNVWYASDADADTVLVFVHGILSDSRDAWYQWDKNGTSAVYWPELVRTDPRFAGTAIFLGGYHTQFDSYTYDFRDAANELYGSLAISIDPAQEAVLDKPNILFITHSAGGIVVRELLTRETEAFSDKAVGLILIASPSIGSHHADRLGFVADVVRAKQGRQLKFNNPFLEILDKDFKNLVYKRQIKRFVGEEWLEHYLPYSKYVGVALDDVIVEPESAGRYFGEPIRIPESDHISIVKPRSTGDPTHRRLSFFYEKVFKRAKFERPVVVRPSAQWRNANIDQLEPKKPPLRINEKQSATVCSGSTVLRLLTVWKKANGRARQTVTVQSVALKPESVKIDVGESLQFANGCRLKLIKTGRDDKHYAIFK